jgi:hypothetical protein
MDYVDVCRYLCIVHPDCMLISCKAPSSSYFLTQADYGPFLSDLAVPCVIAHGCVLETELCGATLCVAQNHKFATCGHEI